MKKTLTKFLCVFYFLVSNGITVKKHYCGGKLVSIKLGALLSNKCTCGGKMKKNCCHNLSLLLKTNCIQNLTKSLDYDFSGKSKIKILLISLSEECLPTSNSTFISNFKLGQSPLNGCPLFLRKQVLLI